MGMAAPAAGKGKSPRPNVNITPLVDVALVVLIIFMVVAPMMSKTFSLSIPPEPKDDTPPPADLSDEPVVLTIDQAGVMRLNKQVVTEGDLPAVIPDKLARAKHKVLHFDADDRLAYGKVLAAVDRCRDAGADSIAIVTKKLPED